MSMQNRTPVPTPSRRFIDKAVARLRGFGRRIAVHFLSFFAGVFAAMAKPASFGEEMLILFSTYIGLVCLFSREMALKASWLIPFGAGALQCGLLLLLGFPFHTAIFFGGIQTWSQRIIQKKGENGTEWFVVLFLLPLGVNIFRNGSPLPILSGFCLIFFGGLLVTKMYRAGEFRNIYGKKLRKSMEQLEDASFSMDLPLQIRQISEELLKTARQYEPRLTKNSEETMLVIDVISGATERLGEHLRAREPAETFGPSEKKMQDALEEAFSSLKDFLESQPGTNPGDITGNGEEKIRRELLAKTRPFRESAAELIRKKTLLPQNLHESLEGIHRSALAIIECIMTDPKDVASGTRFLERYLPATHKVIDEHLRLVRERHLSSEIEKALNLSIEVLQRLEKAFANEHTALMENDVLHFTAELKVLDSLLKMDGR